MNFPRVTRRRVIVGALLALYLFGYAWVRSQQLLVHGVSFESVDGGKRYHHCVRVADFRPSLVILTGRTSDPRLTLANWSYWIFVPLRVAESCGWHFIPRNYGI